MTTPDPERIESADGSFSVARSGEVRAAAIDHLMDEEPAFTMLPADTVCPVHQQPDCSALLNGCSLPSIIGARIRTAVGRARAADAFEAPEPHAYAVEVLVNSGSASAYWSIDDEFDPGEREDAETEMAAMAESGYSRDHLRIVGLVPVVPS